MLPMLKDRCKEIAMSIKSIRCLWKDEDWWAVWSGFILIALTLSGVITKIPQIGKWTDNPFDALFIVKDGVTTGSIFIPLLLLMAGLGVLTAIGIAFMKTENIGKYLLAFAVIFILSCAAYWIAHQVNVKYWGLSYALWDFGYYS